MGPLAADSVQIFGGRSLTKTGMGKCESLQSLSVRCFSFWIQADPFFFLATVIEMFSRTQAFDAVLVRRFSFGCEVFGFLHPDSLLPVVSTQGGAEDILADLGVRQAMKYMPEGAKL